MKINIRTLENGLKIYFCHDKTKHSLFFELVTKFGGINNDIIIDNHLYHIPDGIAHLLEHYVVEQSKYGNYIIDFSKKGIISNASTNLKRTVYYFDAAQDIDYAINTLLKNCYNLNFSEDKFETVKKPVLQEIKMYKDNKYRFLMRNVYNSLFSKISFNSVEGNLEDIINFDLATLKLIYETLYVPKNQFMIIVGNFDEKHLFNLIDNFYQTLNIKRHEFSYPTYKEPENIKMKYNVIKFPTAIDIIDLTWKISTKALEEEQLVKFDLYIYIYLSMCFDKSSVLYKDLIKKEIITKNLRFYSKKLPNLYLISIQGETNNKDEFIKRTENILSIKKYDEKKFNLLKKELIANAIKLRQKEKLLANQLENNIINCHYENIITIDFLQNLQFAEFQNFINQMNFNNYAITILENK